MPTDRKKLRGTILAEDERTEAFFRNLLIDLGFDPSRLTYKTAPSGEGDAANWVRSQYPGEVKLLRRKNYQHSLFLVAIRDGDNRGVKKRRADLDKALRETRMGPRKRKERVATPVPTWSIETWLLALLGHKDIDEKVSQKEEFNRLYREGDREGRALLEAAKTWRKRAEQIPSLPSLADSKSEMDRLDFE